MDNNLLIAVVTSVATASSTTLVAIVAIVQNNRRFNSIEDTLKIMQADLKEFYRDLSRHEEAIANLKERKQ